LKAALLNVHKDEHDYQHDLIFLPFADGIFDMAFKPSPDFKVMEGTFCRAMRGEAFCGNPSGLIGVIDRRRHSVRNFSSIVKVESDQRRGAVRKQRNVEYP
jgi:hypothetical protein